MKRVWILLSVLVMALAGCSRPAASAEATDDDSAPPPTMEPIMSDFALTSSAFGSGQAIPRMHAYRGEGDNISPPLAWHGAPASTVAYALIMDDPDAPSRENPRPEGPWVHWVVLHIPGSQTSLLPGYGNGRANEHGTNDFGELGYGGPMPPPGSGPHRYVFTLYALDTAPALNAGATKAQLLSAIEDHVLAQAVLVGTYER
jgi:Raf kinase inhibitor-like YbhB/YbcL family protein